MKSKLLNNLFVFILTLTISITIMACSSNKSGSWTTFINNTGTYSSPRLVDLNGDKVLDIVLGAGGQEEKFNDTALLALDGYDGHVLWAMPGNNQNVGSAIFADINKDKTPDVIIGGRWAQLQAVDGANGKLLLSFYPERKKPDGSDGGWYNFTSGQLLPDQNKDGIEDILISNGGDARAAAGDLNRPAGRLLVISGANGTVIANAIVPDKKEVYMSPVFYSEKDSIHIIFGTGGESIGGHLYKTSLDKLLTNDITDAKLLLSDSSKGFIATPVITDINKDHILDLVVNTVSGEMIALNGKSGSAFWKIKWPGTEAYTMPAPGNFTSDTITDFYGNFAIGVFPNLNRSIRFAVDGSNGKLIYADTIPAFQYASAVAADLDTDGKDEIIICQSALRRRQFDNLYYSYLAYFNFQTNEFRRMGDSLPATNLASTSWIGDLDADGFFDIVYTAVQYENAQFDLQKPLGLFVRKYSTSVRISKQPSWGSFMGTDFSGRY